MLRDRENNKLSVLAHMEMPVSDSEALPPRFLEDLSCFLPRDIAWQTRHALTVYLKASADRHSLRPRSWATSSQPRIAALMLAKASSSVCP